MHAATLHFGHLYLPIWAFFFAVGLMLALLLTQRTAPLAGVSKEAMWNLSLFSAIAAFVLSRLLLICLYFKSFVAHPILLLTLPYLNISGLLLTAIAVAIYLRHRHLPFANVLDAAAAPIALLWAILYLGAFITGSSDGLPTTLPWAIRDPVLGSIHPVEIYIASIDLALTVILYRALFLRAAPGTTASTGLFSAGTTTFLLDFLAQPAAPDRIVLLDPVQWLALAMLLIGFVTLLPRLAAPVEST